MGQVPPHNSGVFVGDVAQLCLPIMDINNITHKGPP